MASLNFLIRSAVKKNEQFTARYQFSNIDKVSEKNKFGLDFIESKSGILLFSEDELSKFDYTAKDFWIKYKNYKGRNQNIADVITRTNAQQQLLRSFILSESNRIKEPSKEWLENTIKKFYNLQKSQEEREKKKRTPKDVLWHFDNYIKLKTGKIKERTLLKYKHERKLFSEFQDYTSALNGNPIFEIDDIDPDFQYDYEAYLKDVKRYSHNTIAKSIKVLKTICLSTKRYGIQLNDGFDEVGKPYIEYDPVYLSFEELQTIKNTDVPTELKNAKEWLYLSSFLGQRFGDFMTFNRSMVKKGAEGYFIDFTQEKTNKKMHLLLHPTIVDYLTENSFEFPLPMNEGEYNDKIKKVCRLAGITEVIEGRLISDISDNEDDSVYRKVTGHYEKYKLVGSHIGRKSYCTNFYGLLPTSLIMEVSGHSEEKTLRSYIGKKENTMAKITKTFYDTIDYTNNNEL